VNAALLVMSSALAAGPDVIPAGWGENALPSVVQAGGCDACGGHSRGGLLDTLKSKFGSKSSCGCAPAPAPACNPCTSGGHYTQPNLLDKLKDRWAAKKAPPCPCTPACAPAASPAVTTPVAPSADTTKPKDPGTPKGFDTLPKGGASRGGSAGLGSIPPVPAAPEPVTLPPLPGAQPSAPKGGGNPN